MKKTLSIFALLLLIGAGCMTAPETAPPVTEPEPPVTEPAPEPTPEPIDPAPQGVTADGCVRTGCSGQICADEEMASTCEFRPEYACYKSAACERQADGKCGWTPSEGLSSCLKANAKIVAE
jgi:hypothetical protein